jgi:hypothetical protein
MVQPQGIVPNKFLLTMQTEEDPPQLVLVWALGRVLFAGLAAILARGAVDANFISSAVLRVFLRET